MTEPITLINAFSVPEPEAERFLRRWQRTAAVMATQPGLIGAHLYRSLNGDPRFVNVADWATREAFQAATATPEFRASTDALRTDPDLHVTAHPMLYRVAYEVRPTAG